MKFKHILITALVLLCSDLAAQVKFEAKVSKSTLGINERLRVDFEMNQDGDNFSPPDFNGFRVVGGPNQSISHSYVNGRRSYSKTYSYFLAPTARGTFTIGQATVEIEGQTYKTTPVQVEITAAVDKPNEEGSPELVATENIHLVAEISKANPYLNEAITVQYKLYVAPETFVSSWNEIDTPKFADFWSQNTDNREFKVFDGTYNGKPYRYVILRSTVLYPQKTGKLDIEPLSLNVQVEVQTNRRDFFGRPLMTRVNRTVSAQTRTVDVKPLPEEGRPENFSGAVGTSFDFKLSADKTTLDALESMQVEMKVNGKGNLKLMSMPDLTAPASLEVYPPELKEQITTTESGMQGSVTRTYTIIPQKKGEFTIPAVTFSYFDLSSETYKTITSESIPVNVAAGPEITQAPSGTPTYKQPVIAQEQFKFIKLDADLRSNDAPIFFKSPLFWSLLGGSFLLIPLIILTGKKRKEMESDTERRRQKKANRLVKKYLSEAKKNSKNPTQFYEALERALHNYLKAKLSIETSDFSKEKIQQLLAERGVDQEAGGKFISLLKSCEYARYTPAAAGSVQQDYDKAAGVILTIDKQIS